MRNGPHLVVIAYEGLSPEFRAIVTDLDRDLFPCAEESDWWNSPFTSDFKRVAACESCPVITECRCEGITQSLKGDFDALQVWGGLAPGDLQAAVKALRHGGAARVRELIRLGIHPDQVSAS